MIPIEGEADAGGGVRGGGLFERGRCLGARCFNLVGCNTVQGSLIIFQGTRTTVGGVAGLAPDVGVEIRGHRCNIWGLSSSTRGRHVDIKVSMDVFHVKIHLMLGV